MMMSDSFLSDASWLFFAAWSVVVAVVGVAAFGHDLLPSRVVDPLTETRPSDPVQTNKSSVR